MTKCAEESERDRTKWMSSPAKCNEIFQQTFIL